VKEILTVLVVVLLATAAVHGCRMSIRHVHEWWHTNDFGIIWSEDGSMHDPQDPAARPATQPAGER